MVQLGMKALRKTGAATEAAAGAGKDLLCLPDRVLLICCRVLQALFQLPFTCCCSSIPSTCKGASLRLHKACLRQQRILLQRLTHCAQVFCQIHCCLVKQSAHCLVSFKIHTQQSYMHQIICCISTDVFAQDHQALHGCDTRECCECCVCGTTGCWPNEY